MMGDFAVGSYAAITLFLIVLAIVWFLLPFAIFGTKPKLDDVKDELRKINAQLTVITSLLREEKTSSASSVDGRTTPQRVEPR